MTHYGAKLKQCRAPKVIKLDSHSWNDFHVAKSHRKALGMGSAAAERALKVFSPAQMIETHARLYMALFRPAA
jgi:hypothetical protein